MQPNGEHTYILNFDCSIENNSSLKCRRSQTFGCNDERLRKLELLAAMFFFKRLENNQSKLKV